AVGHHLDAGPGADPGVEPGAIADGVLLRMLQEDPALSGIDLVIFDEFHERALTADLGLALTLDVRRHLRPDLKILVMSATIDAGAVAALLDGAPVITSEGRLHEVAVHHLERPAPARLMEAVAATIHQALAESAGSVLVFLPGGGEIRRVERLLAADPPAGAPIVAPLYGDLAPGAQDRAIEPARQGQRKIVLATSIAETSLTIEGIGIVIDSGLSRVPRFDPGRGMSRLETVRVSQASAEQRRFRAGRLGPGICYRLWPAREQKQLPAFATPEILEADLAPLALELAQWGTMDPEALSWLDPPPPPALTEARQLLQRLGALEADGRISSQGRDMAMLGVHPRLAHMMMKARDQGRGRLAAAIAALLEERDILRGERDRDLTSRIDYLGHSRQDSGQDPAIDRAGLTRVRQMTRQHEARLRLGRGHPPLTPGDTGRVLALAFPDRIAQARPGARGQFLLSNGRGAELPPEDPLAGEEFLAVGALDGERRLSRIFLASPLVCGKSGKISERAAVKAAARRWA
ncbi:MAG TPA: ATP-dependent helicase HrpB, partial [Stellaceae bacterium]|nr:ATP-dependent helicase HrpB [Stellaceae bacterium]